MFESFQRNFERDPFNERAPECEIPRPDIPELHELLARFGGASFQEGLYRVIHPAQLDEWQTRICSAFPEFEGRITCFGFDWLGSTFALDAKRPEDGLHGVVMFEPGTGEALEIPANLLSFHDSGLLEFGEAALAISFYTKWRESGGVAPNFDQCIGYKKPLFLGGSDEVDNLEATEVEVYWHLIGQLIRKAKGLPEGTALKVRID